MENQWEPISKAELCERIFAAELRMTPQQARLWHCIRLAPRKWSEASLGAEGGGFWVVGIIGTTVIWYNDIEDGFDQSPFHAFGVIDEYRCNQDELEHAVQGLLDRIEVGKQRAGRGAAAS